MNDLNLISAVRKHEILYNSDHPDYDNHPVRVDTWNDIALELKSTGIICKKRWSSLRSRYARAKYSGAVRRLSGHRKDLWRYESEMQFMEPFIRNRIALALSSLNSKNNSKRNSRNKGTNDNKAKRRSSRIKDQKTMPNESSDYSPLDSTSSFLETNATRPRVIEAVSLSENYSNLNQSQQDNILIKFFENVTHTVRNLPPALQIRAKWEISKIVHQAELEHILQTHPESFMHSGNNVAQSAMMFLNDGVNPQFVGEYTATKCE